ncbi:MAG TPA: hypothetical protein ENK18_08415 [Deltaproteobacteria bacterium]|nr:hypothetical protein [Deltaproteobacteria bacterium]
MATNPTEEALHAAIVETIHRARHPLTTEEITRALARPARDPDTRRALRQLVTLGILHSCPRHRYWDRDEVQVHLEHARGLIAKKPMTRAQLTQALGRLGTGASKSWRERIFNQLKEEVGVYVWPRVGVYRSDRLSTRPPELELYLKKARREFAVVSKRLEGVGVSRLALLEALVGEGGLPQPGLREPPGPASQPETVRPPRARPAPTGEADLDFQREVAEELVFAWQDAEVEAARQSLSRILVNLGAERLGAVGEEVSFDGTVHRSADDLFPGDPARIVEPGWTMIRSGRARLLAKAEVTDAGSA